MKTLGQVAWEAESVELGDGSWEYTTVNDQRKAQAVADAVIAAHEARRWQPIETMDEVTVDNVIAGKRTGSRWVTAEFCRKYLAINAGYTHWTPIPAPPKEAE